MRKCAVFVGALLLAATAAPGADAAEASNLQVMSWNMCGSQRDSWGCAGTGTPEQKIGVVEYHVQNNYVQAALLQEVCEEDLDLLMDELGPGWSSSFFPYQWSQAKVVFGGDFNALPPDWPGDSSAWVWPEGLYAEGPGAPGYLECDQESARTGRPTHDGGWKLDYIFSTEPRRWCGLGNSAYSDHQVLIESISVA